MNGEWEPVTKPNLAGNGYWLIFRQVSGETNSFVYVAIWAHKAESGHFYITTGTGLIQETSLIWTAKHEDTVPFATLAEALTAAHVEAELHYAHTRRFSNA